MGTGRPDFWPGAIISKNIFVPGQATWTETELAIVAAFDSASLINYTVPADKILHIAGGFIDNGIDGFGGGQLRLDADIAFYMSVDGHTPLDLSPLATIDAEAGVVVSLFVINGMDWNMTFRVSLAGYLEDF